MIDAQAMSDAREVISWALQRTERLLFDPPVITAIEADDCVRQADGILAALTAAGFEIRRRDAAA